LTAEELVCQRCSGWDPTQPHIDPLLHDEIRSLLRRARYLAIFGLIFLPWIFQPWAFVTAARALGKNNSSSTPDHRLRRRATVVLLASGLLTALYWAALIAAFKGL
jgi:hypothetical protein